ncbi:MAG: ferrochelatase [Mariprofundaceae bacterium]|nr:ferrochelatase [Mariprofundaceae bacterium]
MKKGILLCNLGTPDAPTTKAVRRYLAEFLWDRRVVEIPRILWWFVLNLFILNFRPKKSAALYQKVWTKDGSPLLVGMQSLGLKLAKKINTPVEIAMRYGHPNTEKSLKSLEDQGCQDIIVLALYPQYSATTTASSFDAVFSHMQQTREMPSLRFIKDYHTHPAYIEALAQQVQQHWQTRGQAEILMMSFHGIPQSYIEAGDPYEAQCQQTAKKLSQALKLQNNQWVCSFQSRLGTQPWLQPYTDEVLTTLAEQGTKMVDVICPGFSIDCLETIDEIAREGAETFCSAGGSELRYIPALNDQDSHVALIDKVLQSEGGF